jgi:hypothetical protein
MWLGRFMAKNRATALIRRLQPWVSSGGSARAGSSNRGGVSRARRMPHRPAPSVTPAPGLVVMWLVCHPAVLARWLVVTGRPRWRAGWRPLPCGWCAGATARAGSATAGTAGRVSGRDTSSGCPTPAVGRCLEPPEPCAHLQALSAPVSPQEPQAGQTAVPVCQPLSEPHSHGRGVSLSVSSLSHSSHPPAPLTGGGHALP